MQKSASTEQPFWKHDIARRTFLKWTAAAGSAAAVGGSLLQYSPTLAQAAAGSSSGSGLPYGADQVVPVKCGCGDVCGAYDLGQAYVKDGKIVYYEGCPQGPNGGSLCLRGASAMQFMNHPDRCKYPMKRLNAKGEVGQFERISWDEAYTLMTDKMAEAINAEGPHTIGMGSGHAQTRLAGAANSRLSKIFSLASWGGSGGCWSDLIVGPWVTLGDYHHFFVEDFYYSKLIVLWGHDKQLCMPLDWSEGIMKAKREYGAKLIVIDPRFTGTAEKADLYLPLRIGSDAYLALGMANVIINEGLTDENFIANNTTGYEAFRQLALQWTPEKVQEMTWCPADRIRQAARMYATTKPAVLEFGRGGNYSAGTGSNSGWMASRAATCLIGLCGQAGVRGAGFSVEDSTTNPSGTNFGTEFGSNMAWKGDPLVAGTVKPGNSVDVLMKRQPYGLRVAMGWTNFASQYGDQNAIEEALKQIPFVVVENRFIHYTASRFADLVLPNALWTEQPMLYSENALFVTTAKAIEPMFEAKSTNAVRAELAVRLAAKLGLNVTPEEIWPWKTDEEAITSYFQAPEMQAAYPGLTYEEAVKHPEGLRLPRYNNQDGFIPYLAKWYVENPADPEAIYFPTGGGTGKLEFESQWFADQYGLPALPVPDEPAESPFRTPDVYKEYPFISHTRVKRPWGFLQYNLAADGGPASDLIREADPTAKEPQYELSPATASKLGLKEGDMIWVESQYGKVQAKLLLSKRIPDWMVVGTYPWSVNFNRFNPVSAFAPISGLPMVGQYGKGKTGSGGGQNVQAGILVKVYKA
jgi:anaerobic selenocysteine-containing dehydrogenase